MQIIEAIEVVTEILAEERERPTIEYRDLPDGWVWIFGQPTRAERAARAKIKSKPHNTLTDQRRQYPRTVTEIPSIYKLRSANLDLLMRIYGQVEESVRPQLINFLSRRIELGGTHSIHQPHSCFPASADHVCELPLIAEFCIRTGNDGAFFAATAKPRMPTIPLAIMMIQLEDMIALNWDLFSRDQLGEIPNLLAPLREVASRQTQGERCEYSKRRWYETDSKAPAQKIVECIDGISKECTQARYFYLKRALRRNISLEIESDKSKVESFLTKLGFSRVLIGALNEAEKDYAVSSNRFKLKDCLVHLRSFIEHLHLEAADRIAADKGDQAPSNWGTAVPFLRVHGYITIQQEKFAFGLYTLLSDEGVHPLMAERVFARLLRNMVIEYGYMFLTVMEAKGIQLQTKPLREAD